MDDALAFFLDLRLRCRGNREAVAIADRCLSLLAKAQMADHAELEHIEAQIDVLRRELEARLGPPPNFVRH